MLHVPLDPDFDFDLDPGFVRRLVFRFGYEKT
jgi:hypothetical protein